MKEDLRAVLRALRLQSPVVVDVPPAIHVALLRRYVAMTLLNGRIAPVVFLLAALAVGHELPLAPRLGAVALFAAICFLREWRARSMLRALAAGRPALDRLHNVLVLLGVAYWGIATSLLRTSPAVSEQNLLLALYIAVLLNALTAISYLPAWPACVATVSLGIAPIFACLVLLGTLQSEVLAIFTVACGLALLQRIRAAHDILLGALAAQAENELLVQKLETYRLALERENASLGSSLRDASHAASRDALTNLYNRRYLAAFAEPLVEAVREHREEVTVCIVDVDHFKRINDAFGHPVGDEVLKYVAVLLGARLRDFDCLARYGGEEFAIILRRCDIARGRRVAEALRHNVASAEIDTDAGTVEITISVGLAQWATGERLDDVVQRADRALYRAKQTGRDRVEVDGNDALRAIGPTGDPTAPVHLH